MLSLLHPSTLALASLFALAPVGATSSTASATIAPASGTTARASETTEETSSFGAPIFVDGKRVTDNEIKRSVIYGPRPLIFESYRIGLITEEEIKRQSAEASDVEIRKREAEKPFASPAEKQAAYEAEYKKQVELTRERTKVSDDEFNEAFAKTLEQFKGKYPILNLQNEIIRSYRSVDAYKLELRQSLQFDKVFLPNNPEEWPIVSIEAVLADSGEPMFEDCKNGYRMRQEWAAAHNLTTVPPEDPVYSNILRQIVRDAMFNLIDFKTETEGLPDDLVLWADTNADGKPELTVTTAEVWDRIKDTVSELDIDRAKNWCVKRIATRNRLAKVGHLLTADENRAVVETLQQPLKDTHISLSMSATELHYFPSVQAYKDYQFLLAGFKRMMAPELAAEGDDIGNGVSIPPVLRQHLAHATQLLCLGAVDIEALLVSAWDYPKGQWKPEGWKWAKKRSVELKAEVDAYRAKLAAEEAKKAEAKAKGEEYAPAEPLLGFYRWWTQLMDDNSEYWDPPPPEGQGNKQAMIGYKMKGRFGERYRNDLLNVIEESDYTAWVDGESVTDTSFYDVEVGTVSKPLRGPRGYYLVYVKKRNPPTSQLTLANEAHRKLLEDDYIRTAFRQYAKEAVDQADVKGL